jgi:hypothetical protein
MRKNLWIGGIIALAITASAGTVAQPSAQNRPSKTALTQADSLLNAADYELAAAAYEELLADEASPALLLRLAFAREQEGRAPEALWALRRAYELRPDRTVLRKMDALAATHHLTGYEYGDRYYFLTLFRRYYQRLLEASLIVGVMMATMLLLRRRRHPKARPWGGALLGYAGLAAVGINLLTPERIGQEVITQQPTPLMSAPTAGGRWLATVPAGQQLPVVGAAEDIWLPVRWQGQRAWVRRGALHTESPANR